MSPGLENGTNRCRDSGGADEIRTRDPLLAKQVLYQLSYDPSMEGCSERTFLRNLLCAINRDPDYSLYSFLYTFVLRPSARIPKSIVAVSLERR